MRTSRLIALFLFLSSAVVFSQNNAPDLDSLKTVLAGITDDSTRVDLLLALTKRIVDSDPKQSLSYIEEAAELSEKLNDKPRMAAAYNSLGSYYRATSDYPKALEAYFMSLRINEELKDKLAMARNSGNLGNIYRAAGDYRKAIEYFNKAFALNKELDRSIGMTDNLSDMGIVYSELEENPKAYESFNEALKIAEAHDDQEGVAIILGNIANLNKMENKFKEAIEYFNKSSQINDVLGRTPGIAANLVNLGELYYKTATDTTGIHAALLRSMGGKEKALDTAESYYKHSLQLFQAIGNLNHLSMAYHELSKVYEAKGDFKKALAAANKFHDLKDSVFSIDNRVLFSNQSRERAELEKSQKELLAQVTQKKRRNEAILFSAGIVLLVLFSGFVIRERRKSDRLLLNILPEEVADELKKKGVTTARDFSEVTVLFTDFKNFTTMSEKLSAQELVNEINHCYSAFDHIISKHNIEKIKTIGDSYMCAGGLPVENKTNAADTVRAALEIRDFMEKEKQSRIAQGKVFFEIRIGCNTGPVVAGIVGIKKFAYDIWGDTVNIASRMESSGEPGKVNISGSTCELVKDQFSCIHRGKIEAKNKGMIDMYFAENKT